MENLMCICVISGYFNPMHPGHVSLIKDVRSTHPNCKLIAIVNSDLQVKLKGSIPFLDEISRCYILQNIKDVDEVFLSVDKDKTVVKSLEAIKVDVKNFGYKIFFCNGGDRKPDSSVIPEVKFCKDNNIELEYGFGDEKKYSSSKLIENSSKYLSRYKFWRQFGDDLLSELGVNTQ